MRPTCSGVHRGVASRVDCGMYIRGSVHGRWVDFLIDSGANVSILGHNAFLRMEKHKRPKLRKWNADMVTADGSPLHVYGMAELNIIIGDNGEEYQHDLCVADISVEAILGYDFMRKFEAIIDLRKGGIELTEKGGKRVQSVQGTGNIGGCQVALSKTQRIPAGKEAIVEGHWVGNRKPFIAMVESADKFKKRHGVIVARGGERGQKPHGGAPGPADQL
jgi:hypothetical protein